MRFGGGLGGRLTREERLVKDEAFGVPRQDERNKAVPDMNRERPEITSTRPRERETERGTNDRERDRDRGGDRDRERDYRRSDTRFVLLLSIVSL